MEQSMAFFVQKKALAETKAVGWSPNQPYLTYTPSQNTIDRCGNSEYMGIQLKEVPATLPCIHQRKREQIY